MFLSLGRKATLESSSAGADSSPLMQRMPREENRSPVSLSNVLSLIRLRMDLFYTCYPTSLFLIVPPFTPQKSSGFNILSCMVTLL